MATSVPAIQETKYPFEDESEIIDLNLSHLTRDPCLTYFNPADGDSAQDIFSKYFLSSNFPIRRVKSEDCSGLPVEKLEEKENVASKVLYVDHLCCMGITSHQGNRLLMKAIYCNDLQDDPFCVTPCFSLFKGMPPSEPTIDSIYF